VEIAYIVRNCGRSDWKEWLLPGVRKALNIMPESKLDNRRALQTQEGDISIPFLYDPNTGAGQFESADIVDYLQANYQ